MSRPPCPPRGVAIATLASLCLAQAPIEALAQADLTRLPLEHLLQMRVVAASSYEQDASEAPSAVSIITAHEIRARGYRTLAEALQSLPGLYVTDDLSYSYLGSRGFNRIGDYNSRFQLSVNGVRTNDALFDMAYIGSELPLDMALVERIEFAPGPGSSIYGSNAVLGVINVVTKTGAALSGWRIAPAAGSQGSRELAVSFGRRFDNGLELLASTTGLRTRGEDFHFPAFDTPEQDSGHATGQNGERYSRGYLRASYGAWELEAFGGRRDKSTPAVYLGSDFLSHDTRVVDKYALAALRYRRDLGGHTQLEARVSAARYDYVGVYPAVDWADNHDTARGRWRGGELRVVSMLMPRHKLVAGVELQEDSSLRQLNYDVHGTYLDRTDSGRRRAIYAQDEFRFAPGWLLNAGVRRDDYGTFGGSTNPRLAVIATLAPGLTAKLLHGAAFRSPNAYELYYQSEAFGANARLGPERSRSTEAVLEGEHDRWRWRASAFTYRLEDLIDQVVTDNRFVFRNGGEVRGRGTELSAAFALPLQAHASISATFHDVHDDTGRRLANSPRYTAKATVQAPLGATGLTASLDTVVVGSRLDLEGGTVPAFASTSLVLTTRRYADSWCASLAVRNAFDRANPAPASEYFAQAQMPGRGRTFWLGLEYRFR